MSDSNNWFPEGKKIKVAGEEFSIKPFTLRVRTKVLRIITDIFFEISKNNPQVNMQNMPEIMSSLITVGGEKLVNIYEIALEKDKEWLLDNIKIKDEVGILQAISEVNDIPFLLSQVKNLIQKFKVIPEKIQ